MFLVVPLSNELAPLEWVLPGLVWPLSNEPCSSRMGFAAQDGKVLLSSASACMKRRGAPLLAAWALLPFVFPSCLGLPSRVLNGNPVCSDGRGVDRCLCMPFLRRSDYLLVLKGGCESASMDSNGVASGWRSRSRNKKKSL